MVYKRFIFILTFNILVLTALIYLFLWSSNQEYLSFTKYGFAGLAIIEIIYIIYFVSKTNKEILQFLENFVINDTFPKFKNRYKEKYFTKIELELNRIAESYGRVKLEKESEHQFMLKILEHIDSAIFTVNENNQVIFSNTAFKNLFPIPINNLEDIKTVNKDLYNTLINSKPNVPELIKLTQDKIIKPFSVKISEFILNKKQIKIFSFSDIGKELAKEEIINWQTLIRILRHEIINSITPISSLSNSMNDNYNSLDYKSLKANKILETSHKSFSAIEKRSKGLLDFIERFKVISAIPKPELSNLKVQNLFNQIEDLFKAELQKFNINISINNTQDAQINADEKLISQVFINLIKNAIDALKEIKDGRITISAFYNTNSNIIIYIEDNGVGIPVESLNKVFIPFYTTKKEGSGIGLSFARQVMLLHNGFINLYSEENSYTKVELLF